MSGCVTLTPNHKPSVALIGAGAMGGALFRGWLNAAAIDPVRSSLFDPQIEPDLAGQARKAGVAVNPSAAQAGPVDMVVIAIKPQLAAAALPAFGPLAQGAALLSVMAGKSCAAIRALLPGAKIVRAMPNLPAQVGAGISGVYADDPLDTNERAAIEALLGAVGKAVWLDSEAAIDWTTALSGSGPAYFFLLAEAMAEAGVALGLDPETAEQLARQTLVGAGALLATETRRLAELRRAVTSPGGTTEAALKVFDGKDAALRRLAGDAVKAAAARAAALSS